MIQQEEQENNQGRAEAQWHAEPKDGPAPDLESSSGAALVAS